MPQSMSPNKLLGERLISAQRLPEVPCWVNLRRGRIERFHPRHPTLPITFVWSMKIGAEGMPLFEGRQQLGAEPTGPRDDWEYMRGDLYPEREGWEVRQRFLAVTSPSEALDFLNAVSRFSLFSRFMRWREAPLRFDHFVRLQTFTKQAVQTEIDRWDFTPLRCFSKEIRELFETWPNVAIALYEGIPISFVITYSAMEAIAATLHIDKVIGTTYRFCKREGCPVSFPLGSQRTRIFCSYECAHLQAVRNSRAKKARSKSRTAKRERKQP
jgi:hypothetical protein